MNTLCNFFEVTSRFDIMQIPDDLHNHAAIPITTPKFSTHQFKTQMLRNSAKIAHFADRSNGNLRGVPLSPFEG